MDCTKEMKGFSLVRNVGLSELSAVLHEYIHTKTGLKLVWLDRDEDNKTFGIAFETQPENDTGVFHILEHSVLCGSDRYPVKEPFVELLKSSMNTFLNAMTFPDKTFYPVSSRNDKDFLNLMRVYLDAVFHPLIYSRPEIFLQEGWHYHFDEVGRLSYQGVVLNEMKGAFADADEMMNNGLNRALFPDTPYRFVSGGDPARIPDLSYEAFLETHKRCYSPSNAYVYLDGKMDIDAVLSILEDEYLSTLPRGERLAPPAMQAPVCSPLQALAYEITPEEDSDGKLRLGWGYVVGRFDQKEKLLAAQVLAETICGANHAPLSRAILEAGLAENVKLEMQGSIAQPWLKLELRHIASGRQEEAEKMVADVLSDLARGMDHSQIEATMANVEFRMREWDYGGAPQGLIFGIDVLDSWLYGGLPEANLTVGTVFDDLRAKLKEGYFEQLIRDLFLENPHQAKVLLVPTHDAGEKRNAEEAAQLQAAENDWSSEDRTAMLGRQEKLTAWQQKEDSPEALATIPHLALQDIPAQPETIPTRLVSLEGVRLLHHDIPTGGVEYVSMYFDADGLSEDALSCLSLWCDLVGSLPTHQHTGEAIMNLKRMLLGRLNLSVTTFVKDENPETYTAKLCVSFNTLPHNAKAAAALVAELLTETDFSLEAQVLEILRQKKAGLYQYLVMAGSSMALTRVQAQLSAAGVANDCTGGFGCYEWLKEKEANFDFSALQKQLIDLTGRMIHRSGITLSLIGSLTDEARNMLTSLVSAIPEKGAAKRSAVLRPRGICREGIVIPADVSFAVKGGSMPGYNGTMQLLAKYVSLNYLWNVIRVQGGAYGAGLVISPSGLAACYSYRDPHGAQSLERYTRCGDFIREQCEAEPNMTGFIIGAVSDASPLLTPRAKGQTADSFFWRGVTDETRLLRREELLHATAKELLSLAGPLSAAMENGGVCVIGGREQIRACGKMDVTAFL